MARPCHDRTHPSRHERASALGVAAQIDQLGTHRGQALPCTDAAHNGGDACASSPGRMVWRPAAQGVAPGKKCPGPELRQWAS